MNDTFTAEFFAGNRERLRQLFTGTAPIVITANGLLQKTADEAYDFRQDSSFWYLTGISEPDVVLVMDKGHEYLIIPKREDVIEVFDGAIDIAAVSVRSGIKDVMNEKDGWRQLEARLKRVQHVATLAANPAFIDFYGMYTNPARRRLMHRIKEVNAKIEFLDLRKHLSRMRTVKQPVELGALRRAADITNETLREVLKPKQLAKYTYEYELEADITRGFRRRGAQGNSFSPVVASGANACTMHHIINDGLMQPADLTIVDVGASFGYYASDIARTVCPSGKPTRRQRQIWEAVIEAQDFAFSLLKPGLELADYEQQSEMFIGEKLRELGLIKSISQEAIRSHFFPHRMSHHVGIDTHDGCDYEEPLKPGAVLAVEPGIYVREEGIGIRIEDDVVITETGIELLSKPLPRELA